MSVTQHVPIGQYATLVYTPATAGSPAVVMFNEGNSTIYVGGSQVTAPTGTPIPANTRVDFKGPANRAIFAISGVTTAAGGTTTALVNAGATTLLSAVVPGTGSALLIDTGPTQEIGTVSTVAGGTITLANGTVWPHAAAITIAQITNVQASTLRIEAFTG